MRRCVRFLLGGEVREVAGVPGATTVLDWLRLEARRAGTKEGCNEGDCGACTVVVATPAGGRLRYQAVNACIRPLGTLDGCHLITVEDLAAGGALHPVQQAMVDCHGSQCGFCTPGFVMSMFAFVKEVGGAMAGTAVDDALAGNLCRCTGYAAIVRALASLPAGAARDRFEACERDTAARLEALRDAETVALEHPAGSFLAPATVDALADILLAAPHATVVAGATDVGLWITKAMRRLDPLVWIGRVDELRTVAETADAVEVGAAATYADAMPALARHWPDLGELFRRLGSVQIRNAGTVGGNVANASPVGDASAALIALGATVHLRRGAERRALPLESFFVPPASGGGRRDLRPGEFVERITVPKPRAGDRFRAYKVSKRFDQDISAVVAAFRVRLAGDEVVEARAAFGGMAAIPRRASAVERALAGRRLDGAAVAAARTALAAEFSPIDDLRASAWYRMTVAGNLIARLAIELTGPHARSVWRKRTRGSGPMSKLERGLGPGGPVHAACAHDSAARHVTGEAVYVDDMPAPDGLVHVYFGGGEHAHARITALDLDAVRRAPGVVLVLTAADVPGVNDVSPTHCHDEPLLAAGIVEFAGQPVFAVAARTRHEARAAARLGRIGYADLPAVLDVDAVGPAPALVTPGMTLARGDADAGLAAATRRLSGRMRIGGQDHFYLEGQVALAIPGEGDEITVHSSTQHPSEVQRMVALTLGVPLHAVTVEVRRMGGGFGGKETQGNAFACIAALVAKRLRCAAKIRPDRDDDMITTGKRHDFVIDYDVGFDGDGRIEAVDMTCAARCGWSADLSGAVTDRALLHADNGYFYPAVRLRSLPVKTNTVSNTAFRGFGGPQGMLGCERMIEEIAFATGLDPLTVRKRNLYGGAGRDVTPYHQEIEDDTVREVIETLERDCVYGERRDAIRAANAGGPVIRRGIALTPVKFGISFTATHLNQAGALVHLYTDGSVQVNHGGTEMGQGLHTKVAQVVAQELGIDCSQIRITATSTGKVPNTSATAASSGADLNGMAAREAARTLKERLTGFAARSRGVPPHEIAFLPGTVVIGGSRLSFAALVTEAWMARVQLSATGFYRTPKIGWDRAAGRGRPFLYFACGAACSEVAVDTLTGEYRVERVDILHDAGNSLNPAIDRGQVEGGFVQGMGWLTTEELVWDEAGRLRTYAPSTYKIPACGDRPRVFNVALLPGKNREDTIFRSKAVGEPPLMLAISVLHAISDAVASVAGHRMCPRLDAPATPERVLAAVERLRTLAGEP